MLVAKRLEMLVVKRLEMPVAKRPEMLVAKRPEMLVAKRPERLVAKIPEMLVAKRLEMRVVNRPEMRLVEYACCILVIICVEYDYNPYLSMFAKACAEWIFLLHLYDHFYSICLHRLVWSEFSYFLWRKGLGEERSGIEEERINLDLISKKGLI